MNDNKKAPIGIIGAMEIEVTELKENMTRTKVTNKAGMAFNQGYLKGREVVVVRSGIGKVNAAVCTQILIDDFGVGCVINTGVAGSLRPEINISDIVISTDAVQHDMDVTHLGYAPGQIPGMPVLAFEADKEMAALAEKCCKRVNPDIDVYYGRVVSGDQFVSDSKVKERLISLFQGSCTEMEGASIAQAAYLNQVPFLILRAISDKADNSAEMDYPTFENAAAHHCARLTMEMVKTL